MPPEFKHISRYIRKSKPADISLKHEHETCFQNFSQTTAPHSHSQLHSHFTFTLQSISTKKCRNITLFARITKFSTFSGFVFALSFAFAFAAAAFRRLLRFPAVFCFDRLKLKCRNRHMRFALFLRLEKHRFAVRFACVARFLALWRGVCEIDNSSALADVRVSVCV